MERFKKHYKDDNVYGRIKRSLSLSAEPDEELFLKLEFNESRPIWSTEHLNTTITKDLEKLKSSFNLIAEECEKVLKFFILSEWFLY